MTSVPLPVRHARKDATRNRALLLESADALIREHGLALSLNAVARHAGVGVGTAYRHFPDRDALVDALFEVRVEKVAAILSGHLRDTDPVIALHDAVLEICEVQAADRGVWEVVAAAGRDGHRDIVQRRVLPLAEQLVSRANASGRLRVPFETTDLPVLLWMGGALTAHFGAASPQPWQRFVQVVLDGFLTDDDPARVPLARRALTIEEIDTAFASFDPAAARPRG